MATFIPPYIGDEVKSSAERKVFEALQSLAWKDAYVLHSLGLPKHQDKVYGEIDFVVVCSRGVACLEIKGGRVECRDGLWYFTDRYGVEHEKVEGPFAQVTGNMFSLLNALKEKFANHPTLQQVQMSCGVVLPDIEFYAASEEMIPEIVWDAKTQDVTAYLDRVFDYWTERRRFESRPLSPSDIKTIVAYLRGNFSFVPLLCERLNFIEKRLVRLTNEQFQVMNALRHNSHLLVEGKAGTGKTLLATEFARRRAEEGKRVLYLTFNKNLASRIKAQMASVLNVKVTNLHALFGEYVPIDTKRVEQDPRRYFGEELPEAFFEWFNALPEEQKESLKYDLIIMDEGQDIIKPIYLYSLDSLLKDGWEQGSWTIFYDEKQNLYNPEFAQGMELIQSYPNMRFELYVNCRNTIQIGEYAASASGVPMDRFLRENGEEVQRISYEVHDEFATKVKEIVKALKEGKVDMADVVFLSPKRYKNSILHKIGFTVNEVGDGFDTESKLPKFSTIHGFKGLDAKVIVLVDMDFVHNQNLSQFLYIAATRARTLLYVLASEDFWKRI